MLDSRRWTRWTAIRKREKASRPRFTVDDSALVEELLDGFLEGETVDEPVAAEPAMVEYPRPESKQIEPACTYLGLPEDRESRFAYPETAHLCFASDPGSPIDLEHQ